MGGILGNKADKNDLEYYRAGKYPPNNSEKYYAGIELNDDEHIFLFQHIGQKNIIDLYAIVYRYFVSKDSLNGRNIVDDSLTNEEVKQVFIDNLPSDIIIPGDKWKIFIGIVTKIKEGIIKDTSLQQDIQEYLSDTKVKELLQRKSIKNKLKQEVLNYKKVEDFNQFDRSRFVRNFISDNISTNDLTTEEKSSLFIATDKLLGEVLSDSQ